MKKNYFAPEMKVVKIKARQRLMAGSLPMRGKDANEAAMASEFEFDEEDW